MYRCLLPLLLLGALAAAERQRTVLWFGNSLTFWNSQWDLVDGLSDTGDGARLVHERSMHAATSLSRIWQKGAAERIATVQPDIVVIQPYGDAVDDLVDTYGAATAELGCRLLVYVPMAGATMEGLDERGSKTLEGDLAWCDELRQAIPHAEIVCVPLANGLVEERCPAVHLGTYVRPPGNVHPGPVGSYLAACCIAAVLHGRPPPDPGFRTIAGDKYHLEDTVLPPELAAWLQAVAWEAMARFHQRSGVGGGFDPARGPSGEALPPAGLAERMPAWNVERFLTFARTARGLAEETAEQGAEPDYGYARAILDYGLARLDRDADEAAVAAIRDLLAEMAPSPAGEVPAGVGASADCTVRRGQDRNRGDEGELVVKRDDDRAGWNRRAYLRFPLPQGESIERATLRLLVRSGPAQPLLLHAVADDRWEEAELNWDNQPPVGAVIASAIPDGSGSCSFDVTAAVRDERDGQWSVMVEAQEDGAHYDIFAREAEEAGHRPHLVVE